MPPKRRRNLANPPDLGAGKKDIEVQLDTTGGIQQATQAMKRMLMSNVPRNALRMALLGLRKRLDLTQQEFADKLGISLRTFSRYETDGEPIPLEIIGRLVLQSTSNGHSDFAEEFKLGIKDEMSRQFGVPMTARYFNAGPTIHSPEVIRLQQALRSFQDLWEVFQPELSPGEERIRKKLDELLQEISLILAEGK